MTEGDYARIVPVHSIALPMATEALKIGVGKCWPRSPRNLKVLECQFCCKEMREVCVGERPDTNEELALLADQMSAGIVLI